MVGAARLASGSLPHQRPPLRLAALIAWRPALASGSPPESFRFSPGACAAMAPSMSSAAARSSSRSAARLAAVQALYQQEMEPAPVASLLHEFHHHRLGATIDGVEYRDAEVDFFDDLVAGVDARREELDGHGEQVMGGLFAGYSQESVACRSQREVGGCHGRC